MEIYLFCDVRVAVSEPSGDRIETHALFCEESGVGMSEDVRMQMLLAGDSLKGSDEVVRLVVSADLREEEELCSDSVCGHVYQPILAIFSQERAKLGLYEDISDGVSGLGCRCAILSLPCLRNVDIPVIDIIPSQSRGFTDSTACQNEKPAHIVSHRALKLMQDIRELIRFEVVLRSIALDLLHLEGAEVHLLGHISEVISPR